MIGARDDDHTYKHSEVPKYQRAKDCAARVPTRAGTIICKCGAGGPTAGRIPETTPILSSSQTGSIKTKDEIKRSM